MTRSSSWATSRCAGAALGLGFRSLQSLGTQTVGARLQPWLGKVVAKLPEDQQNEFKTKAQPAIKFLLGKLKDLQL